ncbi:hypothetical protein K431DRAFT_287681 [Polychaeton citri CBS 116435]|uniref:Uncharacterized protein n=1 Tax=Polychaeton citri CBS 116435 TaxID=1314669 RepID=A0A9P4Q596_9PEZI|nr:hypothetical protein K431DRAFT_287681 [Polychaeton citri CBS 116435]
MQLKSSIAIAATVLLAVVSAAPAATGTVTDSVPTPSATSIPPTFTNVQTLLQNTQVKLNTVINFIAQGHKANGEADYNAAKNLMNQVLKLVAPQAPSCKKPAPGQQPPSSISDAMLISMIQDQQLGLLEVSQDVLNSDLVEAKKDICQAIRVGEYVSVYL